MRTLDFTPFYRTTVGFDRLFDMLDSTTRQDWPPYDIEKKGEDQYRISMAIAGFRPEEIDLTQTGNTLSVIGQKAEQENRELLHQGIAFRNFKHTFNLADHVKVVGANFDNGLLAIDLVREVPEQLKPRRIDIGSPKAAARDNQQKQINQSPERKAA